MPCQLMICGLQVRCQCSATLSAMVYSGIVISQATGCVLCCILSFVQVLDHALTKTMRSHHIIQITIVDRQTDGEYNFQGNSAVDTRRIPPWTAPSYLTTTGLEEIGIWRRASTAATSPTSTKCGTRNGTAT